MTADRSLIARLAVHQSWANTADASARTAPARRALLDRFERQVDPDGVLSPAERARRAEHARKAYFAPADEVAAALDTPAQMHGQQLSLAEYIEGLEQQRNTAPPID